MTLPTLPESGVHGYRLRIRTAPTPAAPTGTADLIVISSIPTDPHPWLADQPPSGDGASIDPSTGQYTIASYTVRIIDNGIVASPASGLLTSLLFDAGGRIQLTNRNAFIEETFDGGATWLSLIGGYVNHIRLVNSLTYEISVGDTIRVDSQLQVFVNGQPNIFGLNAVSCVVGGPVIGGFGPIQDYGPTRWKVTALGTSYSMVECIYQEGWWPVDDKTLLWQHFVGHIPTYGDRRANGLVMQSLATNAAFRAYQAAAVDANLLFPFNPANALTALVQNVTQGTSAMAVVPNIQLEQSEVLGRIVGIFSKSNITTQLSGLPGSVHIQGGPCIYLDWYDPNTLQPLPTDTMPAVNDILDIYVYPTTISENNPLHIAMHPMDLATALLTSANMAWDPVSAANVRAQIGPNVKLYLRQTSSMSLSDALTNYVLLPFGVGLVNTGTGAIGFVLTQIVSANVPTVTWTDSDLVEPESVLFDVDVNGMYNSVVVQGERLITFAPQANVSRPIDDMQTVDESREIDDGDTRQMGLQQVTISLPGVISSDGQTDADLQDFAMTFSHQLFDRYGRGPTTATLPVLRSSVQQQVGGEVVLTTARIPNFTPGPPAQSIRGGSRCLQIVKKTIHPGYVEYGVVDSGSTAQTAVAPTFTLSASAVDAGHVGVVSITNLATLLADYQTSTASTANALNIPVVPNNFAAGDTPQLVNHNSSVVWVLPNNANGSNQQIVTVGFDIDLHDVAGGTSCTATLTSSRGGAVNLVFGGGTVIANQVLQLAEPFQPGDTVTITFTYSTGSTPPPFHNGTLTVHSTYQSPPGLNLAIPQAAGPGIQLIFAEGSSAPPTGQGWMFFGRLIANVNKNGPFPSTILTPTAALGTVIWVAARTTVTGQRPSAWTAWATLTLGTVTSVTGLTATDNGNGTVTLTWTNADTTMPVNVYLRVHGLASYILKANLAAGANTYLLTALVPGTTYDAEVMHFANPPHIDFTTAATVTFTVSATVPTCATPSNPVGFVVPETALGILLHGFGISGSIGSYGYGFGCIGMDSTPLTRIQVLVATETAPGSGTYGAFQLAGDIAEVFGQFAVYVVTQRPGDGLRRQFQACCKRNGANDSAFTGIVTVDPRVNQAPVDFPVPIPADIALGLDAVVNTGIESYFLRITYTPPTDFQFDHLEFVIRHCPIGGTYVGAPITVIGGSSGNDLITAVAGQQYEVTPVTVTRGGFRIFADGTVTQKTRNIGTAMTIAVVIGTPVPSFGTPTADANNIYYTWTPDLYTNYIEVFSQTYASDPGTVETVESSANYVPPTLDYTKTSLALGVTSGLPWRVTTFVPYNQRGVRGMPLTFKADRNAGAGSTSAPSLALQNNPSPYNGTVTMRATFVTTPSAGDTVILYRGGVQNQSHTITSADITAGHYDFVDTTPQSSTTYTYTATQTTGGLTSVASGGVSVTTNSPPSLTAPPTPTIQDSLYSGFPSPVFSCLGVIITFNINATGNPSDTNYDVYTSTDNITFTHLPENSGLRPDSNGNVTTTYSRPVAGDTVYAKGLAWHIGYAGAFGAVASKPPVGAGCH